MQIIPEFKAKTEGSYAEFVVEPLPRGYGVTLGKPPAAYCLVHPAPWLPAPVEDVSRVLHHRRGQEDACIILNLKDLVEDVRR